MKRNDCKPQQSIEQQWVDGDRKNVFTARTIQETSQSLIEITSYRLDVFNPIRDKQPYKTKWATEM